MEEKILRMVVVTVDGVRYARSKGYGSPLHELVDYGSAPVPGGLVIDASDPRHPDHKPELPR